MIPAATAPSVLPWIYVVKKPSPVSPANPLTAAKVDSCQLLVGALIWSRCSPSHGEGQVVHVRVFDTRHAEDPDLSAFATLDLPRNGASMMAAE